MAYASIHCKISSKKKVKNLGTVSSKPGQHINDLCFVEKTERAKALIAKHGLPTELIKADRARTKSSRG